MTYPSRRITRQLAALAMLAAAAAAATPDRIAGPVNDAVTQRIPAGVHPLAQARYDRGAADPAMPLAYVILAVKPSTAQQADLDALLAAQQIPSSPLFHRWLTPEQFGGRFGLSGGDISKLAAWLRAHGLTVKRIARARNWLAFGGTAGQVAAALHTSFHTFQVDGETHFANVTPPAVPAALAGVIGGFLGLDDFHLKSYARPVPIQPAAAGAAPRYTSPSGNHYLSPQDFATIYDVTSLYQGTPAIDGAGQNIAVVGLSDVDIADIEAFRNTYSLPANDPQMILYSGIDPGYNGAQVEGTLDLEWAGAIAPGASVFYVYGQDPMQAAYYAVDTGLAQIISISYGGCEVGYSAAYYRSIAQQANAQGITIVSASGDSGAAGCDAQGVEPFATLGQAVDFPAVLPEVTGVGGAEFAENGGSYWNTVNLDGSDSALSYIPETTWNESGSIGLLAGGGGVSLYYPKPAWQAGPGVPNDGARDVPDVALSAATHDAYLIFLGGQRQAVAGTSCGAPSFSGFLALLNQYETVKGFLAQPGLGNINPQLYRLAQTLPAAFHDVTTGGNVVPCAQGSPDCLTGSFGYTAGSGYDTATGLGSIDAAQLAAAWNTAANAVNVQLTPGIASVTLNDMLAMTVAVTPATGAGTPTGVVDFSYLGARLGSAALRAGAAQATLNFPAFVLGLGAATITAVYSGDAAFNGGSATAQVTVGAPPGAAMVVTWPNTIWPAPADAQGLSWQTSIQLSEVGGQTPAMVTAFAIDGQPQPLAQYFPAPNIAPNGAVTVTTVFRNLAAPVTRTFAFTGTDALGNAWSRQVQVAYLPLPPVDYFVLNAAALTVAQNTSADPACQWAVQLFVDDVGGYPNILTNLYAGGLDLSAQIASIFGTTRLEPYAEAQGTVCFGDITPPAVDAISVVLGNGFAQQLNVSFAGPPAKPVTLSAAPAAVTLAGSSAAATAPITVAVNLSDQTQPWTGSIFPANRTTQWLSASQLSGTGNGRIALTASGAGFEPGVYRANLVIQSQYAAPQSVTVPIMFVLGGVPGTSIASVANAASFQTAVSPGMLMSVFGTQLSNATVAASATPLPLSNEGVSVTVNGLAAPILYQSPTQLNIQVPYAAGAGPAVLGVNNNGRIAGFQFQLSAASPGVFADQNGNLAPIATVAQGGITTLYLTGAGDVTPRISTAWAPGPQTPIASLPVPLMPLSVTVGGIPAFIYFAGIPSGLVGALQVNFQAPAAVPTSVQPLVVTINGVAGKPVNLTVTAK